jgi:hypothetical protein
MIQRLILIVREIRGGVFASLAVLLAVMLSVSVLGLYRIIGGGLEHYIRSRFAASIPPDTIRVSVRQPRSVFLFELTRPGGTGISGEELRTMRRMDGVTGVYPVAALDVPLQAKVSWLGFSYQSDILAFGVPYPLVRGDIVGKEYRLDWEDPKRGEPIPVVVPRTILRSFNDGMAAPNGLPRISERGAIGFGFTLVLGKSSLKRIRGFARSDAVIAGFTDRIDALALFLPLRIVLYYNKKLNQGSHALYQYAYVKVRDHPSLIRVSSLISAMGFDVEAARTVSRQITRLIQNVRLVAGTLQLVVILIAGIAVSFAAAIATFGRLEYYRLLRVIGCSRIFLTGMVFIKYAVLGLVGAIAGTGLLHYAVRSLAGSLHLAGIVISWNLPPDAYRVTILFGVLIPVLSCVPALLRLYFKDLTRD